MPEPPPLVEWFGPPPVRRPKRIFSLCPSITETLFDIGGGDRIAGITRFCVHPARDVLGIPRIGGTKDPDLAAIHALAPDLVLANREENHRGHIEEISRNCSVLVTFPSSPADVPPVIRALGATVGAEAAGKTLAKEIESSLADLRRSEPPRFRFACLIWRNPWMAVGMGTYTSGLLSLAGGDNVFVANQGAYPETSIDELRELQIDRVILPDEPFPFEEKHRAELSGLEVARRIDLVDGQTLTWHGSRTRMGLAWVRDWRGNEAASTRGNCR